MYRCNACGAEFDEPFPERDEFAPYGFAHMLCPECFDDDIDEIWEEEDDDQN